MRILPILSAAFIAAGCTVAFAQGDNATKPGKGVDADNNPTGMNANPAAGNPAGAPHAREGKTAMHRHMTTKPVSSTGMHHTKEKMDTGK